MKKARASDWNPFIFKSPYINGELAPVVTGKRAQTPQEHITSPSLL